MPQWSKKCLKFQHTFQADENWTDTNDYRSKQNMAERLAKSIQLASVNITSDYKLIGNRTSFWDESCSTT